MTVQGFRRWLEGQLGELDRIYANYEPLQVSDVTHDLTAIVEEAARKAAVLGYSDLVEKAKPPRDLCREKVRAYLAACIAKT